MLVTCYVIMFHSMPPCSSAIYPSTTPRTVLISDAACWIKRVHGWTWDAAQINPLNSCVHERKNMRLKSISFIGWIKLYTVMFALQISQLDEIRTISDLITKHFGVSPNPSSHYSSKSPQSFRWFTPNFSSLSPCHIIILKKHTNEYVSLHMFMQFINIMSNLFV